MSRSPRAAPVLALVVLALAACEPARTTTPGPASAPVTASPTVERWGALSRGSTRLAAVTNPSGLTLAVGCGARGRFMELRRGDSLIGAPPEYNFTVLSSGGGHMHSGYAAPAATDQYAVLDPAGLEALQAGSRVEVSAEATGPYTFTLTGSRVAIDAIC